MDKMKITSKKLWLRFTREKNGKKWREMYKCKWWTKTSSFLYTTPGQKLALSRNRLDYCAQTGDWTAIFVNFTSLSLSVCIVSIIFHQLTHFLFSVFAILLSTFLHNLASSTSNRRHQFGFLFIFSVLHVYSTCSIVFYVFVYGISISDQWMIAFKHFYGSLSGP